MRSASLTDVNEEASAPVAGHGTQAFIEACIREIRAILPHCIVKVRMDGAFFSDAIVAMLEALGVEFTISVPFERFAAL